MVGLKTQKQRIISRQEKTSGGGAAQGGLKSSGNLRKAEAQGDPLAPPAQNLSDPDDRSMVRGRNQESRGRQLGFHFGKPENSMEKTHV